VRVETAAAGCPGAAIEALRSIAREVGAVAFGCSVLAIAVQGCAPPPVEPADLVLRGGRVVTVDEARPEAQAVATRGHEIVAVGSDREIEAYVGPQTRVIELAGHLAIPGFIEGHAHFMALGWSEGVLDLTEASTWDDIVAQVGAATREANPGDWIFGSGWHQEKWAVAPEPNVDGVPLHRELSAVSPENPVFLEHASGHAAFANASALASAGIDASTPDPPGGTIVRDADGNPTGLLREVADEPVRLAIEAWKARRPLAAREAEARREMELAGREALSKGITSFQDAGATFDEIDRFRAWAAEGALPVRLYVMVSLEEANDTLAERLAGYRVIPEGDDYLAVRSIKRMIDGALGSHGAWLLEPYSDMPGSTGLVLDPLENIEETGRIAIRHGFQLNTHAIGDRANREVLDLYQRLFAEHPEPVSRRWRIEHAQHLHPDDVPRFAELGVIAAMQGIHASSDGPWLPERLGAQRAGEISYVWRSLLDTGALVTNGTDAPVEDVDPIASFYASVTREMSDGGRFHPEQSMTRMEALRAYTLHNAYAAFEEHLKGSVTPGKLADITVLSRDILSIPEEQIPGTQVVYTIVGGKIAFRGAGADDPEPIATSGNPRSGRSARTGSPKR
jgi:predicted amidohydrolase YtcJ